MGKDNVQDIFCELHDTASYLMIKVKSIRPYDSHWQGYGPADVCSGICSDIRSNLNCYNVRKLHLQDATTFSGPPLKFEQLISHPTSGGPLRWLYMPHAQAWYFTTG